MRKIPTLYVRDENDRRHVTSEVTPGCEWVLAGEGVATRKYDGTCCMLGDNGQWWARREVKPGKPMPDIFLPCEADETTGKVVGWVPMESSSFAKWHAEVIDAIPSDAVIRPGTFELVGPKINGNPEGFEVHALIAHAAADRLPFDGTEEGDHGVNAVLGQCALRGWEGIVWHHPDGRMAKVKVRDFA